MVNSEIRFNWTAAYKREERRGKKIWNTNKGENAKKMRNTIKED